MNSYRAKSLLADRIQRSSTDLAQSHESTEASLLGNIDFLYECAYHELDFVFNNQYQVSNEFKTMVLQTHQTMIEYRFLMQAGLIKDEWQNT